MINLNKKKPGRIVEKKLKRKKINKKNDSKNDQKMTEINYQNK
jgi:hypothetical protein